MKTYRLFMLPAFMMCIVLWSCDKNRMKGNVRDDESPGFNTSEKASSSQTSTLVTTANMIASEQNVIPSGISFCSTRTIPLCTQNKTIGNITIQRGSDGKIYLQYALNSGWYFTGLNLFAGAAAAIPLYKQEPNICSFPFVKGFTAPFTTYQYTYVLSNMPSSFIVAACATAVRIEGNHIKETALAWGDVCSGKQISQESDSGKDEHDDNGHHYGDDNHEGDQHDFDQKNNDKGDHEENVSESCQGGSWATLFTYTSSACAVVPVEPAICSNPVNTFFNAADTANNYWREPTVTVGGYSYTEAEAQKISNDVVTNTYSNNPTDTKRSFKLVSTLKLSHCEFASSPTLGPAVKTIEDWLQGKGKLSIQNLPSCSATVKSAADFIDSWISAHTCSIEE